ncbi:MAG: ubiquinone/menaquinone biosynthesis methyltransferase [Phycisphaerae bacterium]|nr:ubiquinone/menaquinone biosynthesis methyltransferase [Phycisphaerae bacterium]
MASPTPGHDVAATALPPDRPRSAGEVRRLFAAIVPRYDLLNRVLSVGLDRLWRRELAAAACPTGAAPSPGLDAASRDEPRSRRRAPILVDIGCGTGDVTAAMAGRLGSGGRIVGLDFCGPMIDRARRKWAALPQAAFVVADAVALPLADASCDAATMAFALRNVVDREAALGEMARVVRPGGRVAVLEFCRPRGHLWPTIFGFYFRRVLPIVGRVISGHPSAYRYLQRSVDAFDDPEHLAGRLAAIGLRPVSQRRLIGGVAALTVADKPAAAEGPVP